MKPATSYFRHALILPLIFSFSVAHADCFDDAATYHSVNPWILRAIAYVETGFKPNTTTGNTNGSVDMSMMGINSVHLPELSQYNVQRSDLYDACNSIYVSAWLLRKKVNKYGNTWEAVGAYHSETVQYRDIYSAKIRRVLDQWHVQQCCKN